MKRILHCDACMRASMVHGTARSPGTFLETSWIEEGERVIIHCSHVHVEEGAILHSYFTTSQRSLDACGSQGFRNRPTGVFEHERLSQAFCWPTSTDETRELLEGCWDPCRARVCQQRLCPEPCEASAKDPSSWHSAPDAEHVSPSISFMLKIDARCHVCADLPPGYLCLSTHRAACVACSTCQPQARHCPPRRPLTGCFESYARFCHCRSRRTQGPSNGKNRHPKGHITVTIHKDPTNYGFWNLPCFGPYIQPECRILMFMWSLEALSKARTKTTGATCASSTAGGSFKVPMRLSSWLHSTTLQDVVQVQTLTDPPNQVHYPPWHTGYQDFQHSFEAPSMSEPESLHSSTRAPYMRASDSSCKAIGFFRSLPDVLLWVQVPS